MPVRLPAEKDPDPPRPVILTADIVFPVAGEPIPGGALRVEAGTVAQVGALGEVASGREDSRVRRFEGAAIVPGLVNLHSHLEFASLGPLPKPRPFLEWLADLVARSRGLGEEEWLASARFGALRTLEGGMTAVADITRTGAGMRAMGEAGLKGAAALEWVAVGDARLAEEWELFEGRFDALAGAGVPGGVSLAISPHSVYTLSRRAMEQAARFARRRSLTVMTHAAETSAEVALVQGRGGPMASLFGPLFGLDFGAHPEETPMTYLEKVGLLSDITLLSHGVHLSEDDLRRVADARASLALCPTSNAMLCAGPPPDPSVLDRLGLRWGLGTDSLASVPALDLVGEARAVLRRWPATDPSRLLRAMTLDAAGILGLEKTGALVPGWAADIAVLRIPHGVRDAAGLIEGAGKALQVFIDGRERLLEEGDQEQD